MSTPYPEPPWHHVGPHAYFDLVRLARRGRTAVVRLAYILALLFALTLVYFNMAPRYGDRMDANAHVAERFCVTILVMQNLAVLVLTPIYMAASIHEERDRGTLPLLFTTHLTAWQILVGKWLARSAHVVGILLSGLPILSFVQLWGGVDMPMLVANFWNSACLILCVGALSLVIAIKTPTLVGSVVKTYLFLSALFLCCCGPQQLVTGSMGLVLAPVGKGLDGYTTMTVVAGLFSILYMVPTVWLLRRGSVLLETLRTDSVSPFEDSATTRKAFVRHRFWQFPPIPEGDAIAWKERYVEEGFVQLLPIVLFPILCSLFLAHFSIWMVTVFLGVPETNALRDLAVWFEAILIGSFLIYLLLVAFRITGCIVRERQQGTLETILTVPMTPRELLRQKVVGNLLRYRHWLLLSASTWLYLMIFGPGWPVHGFVLLIVLSLHLAFFISLGLFLSIHCRTSVTAHVSFGMIGFFLFLLLPMALSVIGASQDAWLAQCGWNPLAAWITIADEWWRHGRPKAVREIVEFSLLYAAAALMLWMLACRRFGRDPV